MHLGIGLGQLGVRRLHQRLEPRVLGQRAARLVLQLAPAQPQLRVVVLQPALVPLAHVLLGERALRNGVEVGGLLPCRIEPLLQFGLGQQQPSVLVLEVGELGAWSGWMECDVWRRWVHASKSFEKV